MTSLLSPRSPHSLLTSSLQLSVPPLPTPTPRKSHPRMPTFALIWQLLLITTFLREVSNTPKPLLLSKAKFSRHSKKAQRQSPLPFCSNSCSFRRLKSCSCRPLSDKPSAPFKDSSCSFGHCSTSLNLETTIKQSL